MHPRTIADKFLVIRGHSRPIPKVECLGLYLGVLSRGTHFCDEPSLTPSDKKLAECWLGGVIILTRETRETRESVQAFRLLGLGRAVRQGALCVELGRAVGYAHSG